MQPSQYYWNGSFYILKRWVRDTGTAVLSSLFSKIIDFGNWEKLFNFPEYSSTSNQVKTITTLQASKWQVASGYNIVIVFFFLSNDESKIRGQISCFCFIIIFFNIPIFKFLIQFFKIVNLARSFTNHKFGSSKCDKLPRRGIFVLQQIKQAEWPTATKRHKSFVLYHRSQGSGRELKCCSLQIIPASIYNWALRGAHCLFCSTLITKTYHSVK